MSQPPIQPPTSGPPGPPTSGPPGPSAFSPPPGAVPVVPPPKKKRTGLIIGLVIGAVVLLCCGGGIIAVAAGMAGDDGPDKSVATAGPAADTDAPTPTDDEPSSAPRRVEDRSDRQR